MFERWNVKLKVKSEVLWIKFVINVLDWLIFKFWIFNFELYVMVIISWNKIKEINK